jgi:hypothetical protein
MARRWLRSPRIRNTFMVQPAAPAPRAANFGNFVARGALPRPPPPPRGAPGPARALPAAARLRHAPLPGGDVARPAGAGGGQEAPPPESPPPAIPALAPGAAAWPQGGASGCAPRPPGIGIRRLRAPETAAIRRGPWAGHRIRLRAVASSAHGLVALVSG